MNIFPMHTNSVVLFWLLFLFLLEKSTYLNFNKFDRDYSRIVKNLLFGLINRLAGPVLMLPIMLWACTMHWWHRSGDFQFQFLLMDILLLDFANYVFHRLSHTTSFLWRFHEVHHLDNHFDCTTGLRIHVGELFLQTIFRALPVMLFSIPLKSILIFELILIVEGLFHHANLRLPKFLETVLSYVVVTPLKHSVHHHYLYKDWNSNFGFIFIWWDKVFRTFNQNVRKENWKMGLGYAPDLNFTNLFMTPFIFQKLRHRMKKTGYKVIREF